MSGKKSSYTRKRMEQSEPTVLPPDLFEASENESPLRGEIGDSSPPASDETDEDDGHRGGGCKWEKELMGIATNEAKSIYGIYSLPEDHGMIPAACGIFQTARVVIQCFPEYFLRSKDFSGEPTKPWDATRRSDPTPELIKRNATVLVRKLFRPCHLTLLASKDYFNTEIRKLECEHATKIASFIRDLRDGKVTLNNGLVGGAVSPYPGFGTSKSGKERLIGEVKIARSRVLAKRLKPTQVNVAREYGAPRKTMMDRLKKHGIDWKSL